MSGRDRGRGRDRHRGRSRDRDSAPRDIRTERAYSPPAPLNQLPLAVFLPRSSSPPIEPSPSDESTGRRSPIEPSPSDESTGPPSSSPAIEPSPKPKSPERVSFPPLPSKSSSKPFLPFQSSGVWGRQSGHHRTQNPPNGPTGVSGSPSPPDGPTGVLGGVILPSPTPSPTADPDAAADIPPSPTPSPTAAADIPPSTTPCPPNGDPDAAADIPPSTTPCPPNADPHAHPSSSAGVHGGDILPSPTPCPLTADPDAHHKETFMELLKTSGRTGEGRSYYMVMAEFNAERDRLVLDVQFDDLLQEKYMGLAIEICKRALHNPEHLWLQSVAQEFLIQCGSKKDKRMLGFRFVGEPKSIRVLSSYSTNELVERQGIYEDTVQILRTRKLGRLVYLSIINHALACHRSGRSWKGVFSEANIYIIEYQGRCRLRCVILAETRRIYESDFSERVLDLKQINTVVTPKYELNGEYPAFFEDLRDDLAGLTPATLKDTGTLLVLPFHYACMPPKAWGFFIWQLHLVIQQRKVTVKGDGTDFKSVFGQRVGHTAWRTLFRNSPDPVVRGVYWYDNEGGDSDKFTDDLQGMVDLDRHIVQHAHHHPKEKPVRVRKKDENELFAALRVPLAIPLVFRGLFEGREMKFEKELGEVFADYCKLCYDVNEEEAEWKVEWNPS